MTRSLLFLLLLLAACRPSNQVGELVGVDKNRPLEQTSWILVELNNKPVSNADGRNVYIRFNGSAKTVTGFAGCNQLTGSYTQVNKEIKLALGSTKMFCENKMDAEAAFLSAMAAVDRYVVKGNELTLRDGSRRVARFLGEVKDSY